MINKIHKIPNFNKLKNKQKNLKKNKKMNNKQKKHLKIKKKMTKSTLSLCNEEMPDRKMNKKDPTQL